MINPNNTRMVPGWKFAPVPICFGGDLRAIAFCCHPGYPLTFSFKCGLPKALEELGITKEEYIELKDKFSKEHDWDSELTCFKSLSYCCMRRGGCVGGRDLALSSKYKDEEAYEKYFALKRKLCVEILKKARNKEKVKELLEYELSRPEPLVE